MSHLRLRTGAAIAAALAIAAFIPAAPAAAKRAARHRASTTRVWFPHDVLALGYATRQGAAGPPQVMTIGIGLKDPNARGEAALARAEQNPASPSSRRRSSTRGSRCPRRRSRGRSRGSATAARTWSRPPARATMSR